MNGKTLGLRCQGTGNEVRQDFGRGDCKAFLNWGMRMNARKEGESHV